MWNMPANYQWKEHNLHPLESISSLPEKKKCNMESLAYSFHWCFSLVYDSFFYGYTLLSSFVVERVRKKEMNVLYITDVLGEN